MEKEKIITDTPIMIGDVRLVPVVRTFLQCHDGLRGIAAFGVKEVIGVVVISPEGKLALSASGEEIAVEEYARQFPEIEKLLIDEQSDF